MNNFFKRAITGVFFVIVLVVCIVANSFSCFLLFSLIVAMGVNELYSIISPTGIKPNKILGIFGAIFLVLSTYLSYAMGVSFDSYWMIIVIVAGVFVNELYRKHEAPFQNIAFTLFGLLYIAVPFSMLLSIGFIPEIGYSYQVILGFFFLLWTCDTGAYLTGITIGRHPMFARVSPKKSWEGFSGGLILTIIVGCILSKYFTQLAQIDWIIIAILIATFGVWGDLIESLLKRSLQIKDSGNILPGHGGILDRFDSVLFSAPMVFLYLHIKHFIF